MSNRRLFALWGSLFILCAALGFVPVQSIPGPVLTAFSVLFFLPPAALLCRAARSRDTHTLRLIRNLSSLSLGLTLALLVLTFLTAMGSEILGSILHTVLTIVSSPMVCSGYWAASLFLWACLLTASLQLLKAAAKV